MKKAILPFGLVIMLFLTSCFSVAATNNVQSVSSLNAKLLPGSYYYSLLNGNLFYEKIEDFTDTFYKYNIASKKETVLGSIENFVLSGPETAIDNTIYLYVSTDDSNTLYAADLEKNTLTGISEDNLMGNYFVPISKMGRNIVDMRLYEDKARSVKKTGLYSYNIDTKQTQCLLSAQGSTKSEQQEGFLAFDCDESQICTLNVRTNGDQSNFSIVFTQPNGQSIKTISANQLNSEILGGAIDEFKLLGDYLYVSSMGDTAFLAKLGEQNAEMLMGGLSLGLARNYQHGQYVILYRRYTNQYYLLDTIAGTILQCDIPISNGKVVYDVMTDNQYLVVALEEVVEEDVTGPIKTYYYQLDWNSFIQYIQKNGNAVK